jgi:hypothetical protein
MKNMEKLNILHNPNDSFFFIINFSALTDGALINKVIDIKVTR